MSTTKQVRLIISIALLILAGGFFSLMLFKGLKFFEVPSASMEPTLRPGDRFTSVKAEPYARGDIVVLEDPKAPNAYIVKRIVAMAGDTVEVTGGALHINGTRIEEPYLDGNMGYRMQRLTIPPGQVFVLGDNRNRSDDGHQSHTGLDASTIIGKVSSIYSPGSRRGKVPSGRQAFAAVR